MKIKYWNFIFVFLVLLAGNIHIPKAWASEHGCSLQEPDRDGDGVPDKNDAFPDDPSRAQSDEQF